MERVRLLLLGCLAASADGYSNGRVQASCEDMTPAHSGISPQTSESPFAVSTAQTSYSAGDVVTVFLSAPSSRSFKGFLLQAREEGSTSAVGSFDALAAHTQTLSCGGAAKSVVSHSSNDHRTSLQFQWTPASERSVRFHATFVQSYNTYWVAVASPLVKFTSTDFNSTGGTTAPTATTQSSTDSSTARSAAPGPTATTQGSTDSSTARPAAPGSTATTQSSTDSSTAQSAASLDISTGGCGVAKVCFSQPPDCDPAQDTSCFFMSAMLVSPGSSVVLFQLSGPSDGYVSFGFSHDQKMGNDDIYICVQDSSGLVQLQRAFSTGTTTPQSVPLGNVSDVKTSAQNHIIRCSFTSTNSIYTQRSSQSYLLYAHGPSHNGQIQIHRGTFVSGTKVDITKPAQVGRAQRPHIIKAHGALMLVAWMTTGSLGMMVARFNGLAKGHTLCGKDLWFVVHVSVMCLTVTATIIAFILAFSYARSWSGGAHPVLGCLVMILSFLQPLGALLRCGPQHPNGGHIHGAPADRQL